MLIQRSIFIPKRGQQEKVVQLIKAGGEYVPFQVPNRILLPSIGPNDRIVFELEFKDISEYDLHWSGWSQKVPESFWEQWNAATENGGSVEIWQVAG